MEKWEEMWNLVIIWEANIYKHALLRCGYTDGMEGINGDKNLWHEVRDEQVVGLYQQVL